MLGEVGRGGRDDRFGESLWEELAPKRLT